MAKKGQSGNTGNSQAQSTPSPASPSPLGLPPGERMLPPKVSLFFPQCSWCLTGEEWREAAFTDWWGPTNVTATQKGEGNTEGELWVPGHSRRVEIQSFLLFHCRLKKGPLTQKARAGLVL